MAHRVALEAETDLDDIWYYIAGGSGSLEIADRFVDSLTERFYLLSRNPFLGRRRDEELARVCAASLLGNTSSSIASKPKRS